VSDGLSIAAALIALAGFFAVTRKPQVDTPAALNLDVVFRTAANRTGIDWRLLKAVARRESALNSNAFNAEPGHAASSYGLMQIFCPSRKFLEGWATDRPADGGCDALFDPNVNARFGSGILAWNLQRYGFPRGVSIYNNWSQRHRPSAGPFDNQGYVDDVIAFYIAEGGDPDELRRRYGAGSRGE